MPFNRTIVELKRKMQTKANHPERTFNRTIVELKLRSASVVMNSPLGF